MSEETMPASYMDCVLEGDELDKRVAEVLGLEPGPYSTDWRLGGPVLDENLIFLDPPHVVHMHGGPNAGTWRWNVWTATVSASKRTKPNPRNPELPRVVGRGMGKTALIAAMRAVVASFESKV